MEARIMSLKAMSWAFALEDTRLTPPCVAVLLAICDAAHEDEHFECRVSQKTLSKKSKVSEDSISRRVADLSAFGYLHVVKRRGPDGCRLSNCYIVLVDDGAKLHAKAQGWSDPKEPDTEYQNRASHARGENADGESSADHPADCGMDHPAGATKPTRRNDKTNPHCCGMAYKDLTSKNGVRTSSSDGAGSSNGEEEHSDDDLKTREPATESQSRDIARLERWNRFFAVWPWRETELPGKAKSAFLTLCDVDQIAALDGAPQYWAAARASGLNHPAQAHNWLKDEGWKSLKARTQKSAAALGGAGFFVIFGTAQFWRWVEYHQAARDKPLKWVRRGDGSLTHAKDPNAIRCPLLFKTKAGFGFYRDSEWPPPMPRVADTPEEPDC
jgi:hypothetical protein